MKRLLISIFCCVFCSFPILAANVELIVSVPKNTPEDAQLSLGGDFNSWKPDNKEYQLEKLSNGTYRYLFTNVNPGVVLNFKVTRGNWNTVEIAESGSNRDNRAYLVKSEQTRIEINVADWADLSTKEVPSSVIGTVVYENIELPTFAGTRQLRIYLPADYHQSQKRYPVIYMTDGQNLYDNKTANAGEWQIDELMERFGSKGSSLSSIVVGIDHAGEHRSPEYMPFVGNKGYEKNLSFFTKPDNKGSLFADWLANELKPNIDKRFRTLKNRKHTTIMGSSMGGLISCYTALKHQQVFSKAACLSSAFLKRLVGEDLVGFIQQTSADYPMKIYMDMGDNEFGLFGDDILEETQQVYDLLLKSGFSKDQVRYSVIKGGTHDEPSWRNRTEDILLWLNH